MYPFQTITFSFVFSHNIILVNIPEESQITYVGSQWLLEID